MTEFEVMRVGRFVPSLTGEQIRITRAVRVEKVPKRKRKKKSKGVVSRFLAEGEGTPSLAEQLEKEVVERVEERQRDHAP